VSNAFECPRFDAQDGVFSAAYSGASQPFSPAAFLYAWWCHADHHLAGYQQQDAHEFYLFALSGLSHSRLPDFPPPSGGSCGPQGGIPSSQDAPNGAAHAPDPLASVDAMICSCTFACLDRRLQNIWAYV
jgi:hypothetical protein